MHKWPVFLPRGGEAVYAATAISALRAHAAQVQNFRSGLFPAVSRIATILLNRLDLIDMNGPKLPFM
jgi:hypothetical protein